MLGYWMRRPDISSETASTGLLRNFLGAGVGVGDGIVCFLFLLVFNEQTIGMVDGCRRMAGLIDISNKYQ